MLSKQSIALGAFALVLAFAIGGLSVASAHSRPVRFDPAPGAVLDAAPAQIRGWFTSDIRRAPESFIRVLDASGKRVDGGDVTLSSNRREMLVALNPGQPAGQYLVHWSTLDDGDGEVFAGCHLIFVGQAAADNAAAKATALDGGTACPANTSGAATSTSAVTIDMPDKVEGSTVTLRISPVNFKPRAPTGSGKTDGVGHYHIYLDKVPLDVFTGHSHEDGAASEMTTHEQMSHASEKPEGGLVENPVMWVDNTYTFKDLSAGKHTVSVALFYDDHTAYAPPVVASRTFTVAGDSGGGVPLWALVGGIVAGLAVGAFGFKVLQPAPAPARNVNRRSSRGR